MARLGATYRSTNDPTQVTATLPQICQGTQCTSLRTLLYRSGRSAHQYKPSVSKCTPLKNHLYRSAHPQKRHRSSARAQLRRWSRRCRRPSRRRAGWKGRRCRCAGAAREVGQSLETYGKSIRKIMDFHDFARFSGKLGKVTEHPPKVLR